MSDYIDLIRKNHLNRLEQLLQNCGSYTRKISAKIEAVHKAVSGQSIRKAAKASGISHQGLCDLLKDISTQGADILLKLNPAGRPAKITPDITFKIVEAAQVPPSAFNLPFDRWNPKRLRKFLIATGRVQSISGESIRKILKKKRGRPAGRRAIITNTKEANPSRR